MGWYTENCHMLAVRFVDEYAAAFKLLSNVNSKNYEHLLRYLRLRKETVEKNLEEADDFLTDFFEELGIEPWDVLEASGLGYDRKGHAALGYECLYLGNHFSNMRDDESKAAFRKRTEEELLSYGIRASVEDVIFTSTG